MKPYERFGVTLEDIGEIDTAATSLEFIHSLGMLPDKSQQPLNNLAIVLRDMCTVSESIAPVQEQTRGENEASTTLDVADRFDALMVTRSLELASQHHPDELVRQSAKDMIRSHEQAVFEGSMEKPTPEA